ncbi:MAG TPA: hypothetical protein VFL90_01715 [Methylomirabilota bacterium]|nr:hypothetical protein [Methylomirabilota bacterium]
MSTLGATGWGRIGANVGRGLLWIILLAIIGFLLGAPVAHVLEILARIIAVVLLVLIAGDLIARSWPASGRWPRPSSRDWRR